MKLGFSIYADVVLATHMSDHDSPWQESFRTNTEILSLLKHYGFSSIEVKLPPRLPMSKLSRVLDLICSFDFSFSFHAPGSLKYPDKMPEFTQYLADITRLVNSKFGQRANFVVHGLSCYHISKKETLSLTIRFFQEIIRATAPFDVDFSVELLRDVPLNGKVRGGTSFSEILHIVNAVKSQRLGVCWDFGHSFFQSERGIQPVLPPAEFMHKIMRTHIHDYKNNVTHLPLGHGNIPFGEYLKALMASGFSGVLNLELNPGRITDPENFKSYILESVTYLKNVMPALELTNPSPIQGAS